MKNYLATTQLISSYYYPMIVRYCDTNTSSSPNTSSSTSSTPSTSSYHRTYSYSSTSHFCSIIFLIIYILLSCSSSKLSLSSLSTLSLSANSSSLKSYPNICITSSALNLAIDNYFCPLTVKFAHLYYLLHAYYYSLHVRRDHK